MGTISQAEIAAKGGISPIDNVLRGDEIKLLVGQIRDAAPDFNDFEIDEETISTAELQYENSVRRAQIRLYGLMEQLGKLTRVGKLSVKPHKLRKYMNIEGHCTDIAAHQRDGIAITRRGVLGYPLTVKIPLDEIVGDLLSVSDDELSLDLLGKDHPCGPSQVEVLRSRFEYTIPEGYGNFPLIKKMRGRVKTRGDLADKLTDKVLDVNGDVPEAYDFIGVQLFTSTEKRCYNVLEELSKGIGIFNFVEGSVKDRIAKPKDNGYQDLKFVLAFFDPERNHYLQHEIQILTPEIDAKNNEPERTHAYYKREKWKTRLHVGSHWVSVRETIGKILGEDKYILPPHALRPGN